MRQVTVMTSDLIENLKSNYSQHIDEYEEAIDGWKKKQIEDAMKVIAAVEQDFLDEASFPHNVKPESHGRDYERAIGMLEMHTDKTIELSEDEYRRYIEDDWDWSHHFKVVGATYGVGKERARR